MIHTVFHSSELVLPPFPLLATKTLLSLAVKITLESEMEVSRGRKREIEKQKKTEWKLTK